MKVVMPAKRGISLPPSGWGFPSRWPSVRPASALGSHVGGKVERRIDRLLGTEHVHRDFVDAGGVLLDPARTV